VTIVFGHGEPEVWHRLLGAISSAGLVMSGSWPARTEAGGQQGKANIVTTLTMSCRPAPNARPEGGAGAVETEVKREVRARMSLWERSGLAPTDMLMASAGPAMEVVGRYGAVLDNTGDAVEPDRYLITARQAVQDALAVEVDNHPLETFDARTRFALWWVRLFGRQLGAKSELRWQALAADLDLSEVRDLVPDSEKGCRLVAAKDFKGDIGPESAVIDVALAMARAWPGGLDAAAEVLAAAGRDTDDSYLWGAIAFLANRLPDADPDAIAWNGLLRNRRNVGAAARGVVDARRRAEYDAQAEQATLQLF
jgi:putative DNA methylase